MTFIIASLSSGYLSSTARSSDLLHLLLFSCWGTHRRPSDNRSSHSLYPRIYDRILPGNTGRLPEYYPVHSIFQDLQWQLHNHPSDMRHIQSYKDLWLRLLLLDWIVNCTGASHHQNGYPDWWLPAAAGLLPNHRKNRRHKLLTVLHNCLLCQVLRCQPSLLLHSVI